jgi:hypothetical protein
VLRFVSVSLGTGRQARCGRCHGPAPEVAYRSAAEMAPLIAEAVAAAEAPGPNVELTGPEPFDHPELPAIVASAARQGVARLKLDTDATALARPGNADGCIAAGVRHVRVVLLGGSPGIHDALAGAVGAFDAALTGIRAFVDAGAEADTMVHVTALVPVCRHNVHDLVSVVVAAVGAGADAVTLMLDDTGLDLAAAAGWLTAACDTGVVNAVWVEVEGAPFCLLPGYELHLVDVVGPRPGSKVAACRSCALDRVCGGGPAGASADTLAALAPPAGAAELSRKVSKVRGAGAP